MGGRRRWIWLGARLVVTGLAVAWVLSRARPEAAVGALQRLPIWLWFVPAAVLMFNTSMQAVRLCLVLGATGNPTPFHRVLGALCRGAFLGMALPSGGQEVAKAAFLSRVSGRLDAAVAALLTVRVLGLPTWMMFLCWGLVWGLWRTDPVLGTSATAFLMVAVVVLAASLWGLLHVPSERTWLHDWLPARLALVVDRVIGAFVGVRAHPRTLVWVALLSLPCGLLNTTVVWLLARGYGVDFRFGEALALIPAADVVIWLPISIGGIGVRESMMLAVFGPRGVAEGTAVAIGLTRWTGELTRAALGGILVILGHTDGPGKPDTNRSTTHG